MSDQEITVLLDMDGVLTNFVGRVAWLYGIDEERLLKDMNGDWDICKALEIKPSTMWNDIHEKGTDFWYHMESHSDGKDLYRWLKTRATNIMIATSPSQHPACLAGKFMWMQSNMEFWYRDFFITPNKEMLAPSRNGEKRILIDDSEKNCKLFEEHGGIAILYPRPYNELKDIDDPFRHVTSAYEEIVNNHLG